MTFSITGPAGGSDCCQRAFTLSSCGLDATHNIARAIHRYVVLPREEPAQLHLSGCKPNNCFKGKSQAGITILFCVCKPILGADLSKLARNPVTPVRWLRKTHRHLP